MMHLDKNEKFVFFIDDFLSSEQLVDIQKVINDVTFEEHKNCHGVYAYRYTFTPESEYQLPHKETIISKIESLGFAHRDTHNFTHMGLDSRENIESPLIHKDISDLNFILYLYGSEVLTNGTGFWYDDGQGNEVLSAHIGFVKNRAVFFTGNSISHSDLQYFANGSGRRFSLSMFIYEK